MAQKKTFAVGDLVMLNSSGPHMTVQRTKASGDIECRWFDRDGKAQMETFAAAMLKSAEGVGVDRAFATNW